MKDMGKPSEYLGIKIERNRSTRMIKLSQTKFIEKMLKRFGFDNAHGKRTPMVTNQILNRERKQHENENRSELAIIPTEYREAIGSLSYLANCTRPDIT